MSAATRDPRSTRRAVASEGDAPGKHVVLVLSSDAVAAALIGALVETLGYLVRFFHPPETPDDALRRARPTVVMIDCEDPTVMTDETLGHAKMRGTSVVIFGTSEALGRVRQLALEHELDTLIMPASLETLDDTLRDAVSDYC